MPTVSRSGSATHTSNGVDLVSLREGLPTTKSHIDPAEGGIDFNWMDGSSLILAIRTTSPKGPSGTGFQGNWTTWDDPLRHLSDPGIGADVPACVPNE
jgi:hypothetical protein